MKAKFFFKETVWREVVVELTDAQKNEVFDMISSNKIQNCDDLYDFFYDQSIDPIENRFDYNTSEPISKSENGDQPTIEVCTNNLGIEPDLTN